MKTFVRKSFYVEPPPGDATIDEWHKWQEADKKAAIKAHRAYTLSMRTRDIPEAMQVNSMRKVGGVWRQATSIGFCGDAETGRLEPMEEATQEREYIRFFTVPKHVGKETLQEKMYKAKVSRQAFLKRRAKRREKELQRQVGMVVSCHYDKSNR